jgi:von Willebrand factor type A domain.
MNDARTHKQIFPQVIDTVAGFIRQLEGGTTVYIMPFAGSVIDTKEFAITGSDDNERAIAYLRTLQANGDSTAVYNSIESAISLIEHRGEAHKNDRPAVMHVYTDGEDNVSRVTLNDILEHFSLRRGPHDWLFYTELGLPVDLAKKALFDRRDNVVYVSEKAGVVRPIIQIEPLLTFLNFGNVLVDQTPTYIRFAVRSSQPLPPKLTISAEAHFEALNAAGVLVQVDPREFAPDPNHNPLKLALENPRALPHGTHLGKLKFKASDPLVVVIPDEVGAQFSYQPKKTLDLSPSPGERLPLDFGIVTPGTSAAHHFRLTCNEEALQATAPVDVHFKESGRNPAPSYPGQALYLDGSRGKRDFQLDRSLNEIAVIAEPPATLRPGTYGGTFELSSRELELSIDGHADAGHPHQLLLDWTFTVPQPPRPPWEWALLVAAILAIAAYVLYLYTRPPRFRDFRLILLEPRTGEVDLAGLHSMSFGPSSQNLTDIAKDFAIRAVKKDSRIAAMLELPDSGVTIRRKNQKIDVYGSEELYAGDIIDIPPYQMRVESFSLGSDESA